MDAHVSLMDVSVMDNNELVKRIFDKFDHFEDKLDTTCGSIRDIKQELALLKQQVHMHLQERDNAEKRKEKRFYIVMSLMAVGFSLYEIGKEFI